jgi:hypothetical protein
MRMMAKIQVPTEEGGRAIKDGSMGKVIEESLAAMKPECAYFFLEDGLRTVLAVFDLKSPSEMVTLFEPGKRHERQGAAHPGDDPRRPRLRADGPRRARGRTRGLGRGGPGLKPSTARRAETPWRG